MSASDGSEPGMQTGDSQRSGEEGRAAALRTAALRKERTLYIGMAATITISIVSLVLSMSGFAGAQRSSIGATTLTANARGIGAPAERQGPVLAAAARSATKGGKGKAHGNHAAKSAKVDGHPISTTPFANGILLLSSLKKFPVSVLPTVKNSNEIGGRSLAEITPSCGPETVDLGTWCLEASAYPVPNAEQGKNDFFFASQACVAAGGWLPSAAQLIGAAKRVRLESTIHDSPTTAIIDEEPADGLKDQREMSSTLVTTAAGSSASGSEGVSEGSTGNPETGEPNPTPQPAVPAPETLQYVTVYSNGTNGGFAGSQPVSQPQSFRCAYMKSPGAAQQTEE